MMIALQAGTIDHMSQPLPDTKSATQRELALGIYESKYIFDRLSSGGDSKERTALKDKTFGAVFLVEYIIYIVPTVLLTPRSLLQLQVTLLESIWE